MKTPDLCVPLCSQACLLELILATLKCTKRCYYYALLCFQNCPGLLLRRSLGLRKSRTGQTLSAVARNQDADYCHDSQARLEPSPRRNSLSWNLVCNRDELACGQTQLQESASTNYRAPRPNLDQCGVEEPVLLPWLVGGEP
jgi:hypothetical protein